MRRTIASCGLALTVALAATVAAGQSDTTFTYQGSLNEQGVLANGAFTLDFALFDALIGGTQIESVVTFIDHPVADGQFTVELDFGASAFDNTSRWIAITVNGSELSPRQPITHAPYSIQTRGLFVDANHNVGIGTSLPDYPLHVESDGAISIYSVATAGTGTSDGVFGLSVSTSGRGVVGMAIANTGTTSGVYGNSGSTGGRGIFGWATASIGNTYGVYGLTQSTSGRGVYGEANSSTGTTYGGQFQSDSTAGRGVSGLATASAGTTYGGQFQSDSTAGRGVSGLATASAGITYGVYGTSQSNSGRGVFGEVTNSSGINYGVFGLNQSTSGRGVYGAASAAVGLTYGGLFLSDSTDGRGVHGLATSSTGVTFGGSFESDSTVGRGVYGLADANSGVNYGGWFESDSTSGRAIFGLADATSGVNYGVVGHSNSSSGFDFWASGAGTNYGAPSSRRWKSNVVPIGDPLYRIAQLRGVYFDWDEEHGGAHDVGMIAEEVGAVLPEIVQYEENGIDAIGMDYSKMTPLLVEGLNALRAEKDAQIASLEHDLELMSERNADLESRLIQLETLMAEFAVRKGVEQ